MNFLQKRIKAFECAFKGIYRMFRYEAHAQIHLIAAIGVIVAGCLFRVSSLEWCVICICIGGVLMAEGFNTAIEKLADKVSREQDPLIGMAKDVAAGAVLILAISTVVVAALIFIPKL